MNGWHARIGHVGVPAVGAARGIDDKSMPARFFRCGTEPDYCLDEVAVHRDPFDERVLGECVIVDTGRHFDAR